MIAVDNSPAMVERCREYLHAQDAMFQELLPVQVIEADILALDLHPTSLVTLNFTLQFIPRSAAWNCSRAFARRCCPVAR